MQLIDAGALGLDLCFDGDADYGPGPGNFAGQSTVDDGTGSTKWAVTFEPSDHCGSEFL